MLINSVIYFELMTAKPPKTSKAKKASFDYYAPAAAIAFVIIGLLFISIFTGIGLIVGLVWLYRYSGDKRALRHVWWLILAFFVIVEILLTVSDVHKSF